MMVTLLSSPLTSVGPTQSGRGSSSRSATAAAAAAAAANRRYDPFEQPSSPTFKHEELPAEFGDQSFGSSMSLGSSFELSRIAAGSVVASSSAPSNAAHHEARSQSRVSQTSGGTNTIKASRQPTRQQTTGEGTKSRRHDLQSSSSDGSVVEQGSTMNGPNESFSLVNPSPLRRSPHRTGQESLGAALGTILNSKSPGLAAKMSSPYYMDMSPLPLQHTRNDFKVPAVDDTPLKSKGAADQDSDRSEILPPGSAMKEDTPVLRSNLIAANARNGSVTIGGGSLGRLFGTELSQSQQNAGKGALGCVFFDGGAANDSFGSQSSPDKEPPLKRRPSSLPLPHANAHARPSLRSVGMGPPASNSIPSRRPNLMKSMTTGHPEGKDRNSNLDVLRMQQQRVSDSALPTVKALAAFGRPVRSRAGSTDRLDLASEHTAAGYQQPRPLQKTSLPPSLHPTILESPSPSKVEGLAGYFFDPQSPENERQNGAAETQIKAKSSKSTIAALPSRPRLMEKAASSAVLPSMVGTSLLGKRSNPYSKQILLSVPAKEAQAATSLHGSLGVASSSSRTKAPAPRRCHSALDNSAAFVQAGLDMSTSSMEGDCSIDASPSLQRDRAQPSLRLPPGFDASGSPVAPTSRPGSRPSLFRRPSKDDSSPLGYGKRFALPEGAEGSPQTSRTPASAEYLPGFGASEREGKILPCFNVKDDGLMRITADTLVEVMSGRFDDQMDGFQIVDCRFGYEYDGGHIQGAINLSTMEKVKRHFLEPTEAANLPLRTQSGKLDANGKARKKVLIFHCEFSLKRAPSSALALRQADRSLAHDYPSCHYPEVYVLQGGYCNFYSKFGQACDPQNYVQMDDPNFQERRSVELNGFRKQFSRHRSFTYGDARQAHSEGSMLQPQQQRQQHKLLGGNLNSRPSALSRTIKEEDSSFEGSSSGGSPSALQAQAVLARRRGLARYATATGALASAPVSRPEEDSQCSSSLGVKPLLSQDKEPATCVGDLSFDSSCSIVGNDISSSSFDAGIADSPCATAASGNGNSRRLPALAPGPIQSSSQVRRSAFDNNNRCSSSGLLR